MVVLGWELLLSPKVGTGTQIPFSPTSLDMQPLSLGTLQGSDPPEEPGQVGCTSGGAQFQRGDALWVLSCVEAAPSTPPRWSWQCPTRKLSLSEASPWELQVFVAGV